MMSAGVFVVLALFPLLGAGDVCLSPDVRSEVYTTSETAASSETVVIIEFTLKCKNGVKDLNLYADFNGYTYPASRLEGTMDRFQVSFSAEHKALPSGTYNVNFYDEEGYSDLRKAQRGGEGTSKVKALFSVLVSHTGASKGQYLPSELVAAGVGALTFYFAYASRASLQSS